MRELPIPSKTFWDNKKGLKPLKEKGACGSYDLRHTPLTEIERYENWPQEFQLEEKASNHAVLFDSKTKKR